VLRAHIRACAIAKTTEAASLVATGHSGGGGAIRNAVVVTNPDSVRASSAAMHDCHALFRGRGRDAKYLGNLSHALVVSGRTRTVCRCTGDKRTGVAVTSRETASTAVGARQRRSYETNTRILLNSKIFIRNGESKRGNRTNPRNNSYRNQNSCHLFSSLISTNH
jgi:hypothetical protein